MKPTLQKALFFFFPFTVLTHNKAPAQFALGGELGYNMGLKGISAFGPGIRLDVLQDDDLGVVFGLNYFIPFEKRSSVRLTPSGQSQPAIDAPTVQRYVGYRYQSVYKRYIISEYDEAGLAMYLFYGFGANLFFYKEVIDRPYDPGYTAPEGFSENTRRKTSFGLSADVGIGFDFPLTDHHILHADAGYSHTFELSQQVDFFRIPPCVAFRIGYRYEFD